ncbi:MAG TPA: ATPase, T2SS/T4P/T4SS family [Candidatus Saccharimonadales bacterium]|nr:ATPase, T2SS/T4P/T4SS family [Candidatus Saccharimonadales bacterium]
MASKMGRVPTKTNEDLVNKSIQQILERATKNGVSNIHIEPNNTFVLVRYRRGSSLYIANKLPKHTAEALVRQLKNLAGLDTQQTQAPQVGEATVHFNHGTYKVVIATLPVLDGERVTIRLRGHVTPRQQLESLGLWGKSLTAVEHALAEDRGLVIVGSRQARAAQITLAGMIQKLYSPTRKRVFIEPDETITSLLHGIKVVYGHNYAQQLKLLSEREYGAIAISNVADHATARQVDNMAKIDKKLLVRLPVNSVARGLILWHQLNGHLSVSQPIVVAQINVMGLCQYCRESYEPSIIEQIQLTEIFKTDDIATMKQLNELERLAEEAGLASNQPLSSSEENVRQLWRAKVNGCEHCDHTGFSGDIGIFEVYKPSDHFRSQLAANESVALLQQTAIKDGMISLKVDALTKALRGLIDFPTLLSISESTQQF